MTSKLLFAAACLLAAPAAWAQPSDGQPPAGPPPEGTPPPPVVPVQPPQPPQPGVGVVTMPPAATIAPVAQVPAAPALLRPDGFSLGIGVGYKFPTTLTMPNTTSVRFRFANAVEVEPSLVLASTSHTVDQGMADTQKVSEFALGATLRIPMIQRRRTELQFLGGVDLDYLGTDPNNMNDDDVTTTTTVTLRYGVAVGLWLTQHVQASMSATNGLVTYVKNRQEQGIDSVTVTSDTTFGLIFDPTVIFMIHLYN